MRNIRFYAASSAIVLALLIFGLSLLRGAEGIVVSDRLKKKAAENTALISGSTFEEKEQKTYKLPDTPAELNADQINTIVIDGIELDFPIKVKDLPEEFDIAPYYLSTVRSYDNTEKNEIDATLIYARQSIANVHIYSDETAVTDESVITDIRFSREKSRYMPQITIGRIDINTPLKDMDRIYGSGSDIYTYLDFFAENENGAYCIGYDDYSLEHEQIDYINRYYYIDYEIPEN